MRRAYVFAILLSVALAGCAQLPGQPPPPAASMTCPEGQFVTGAVSGSVTCAVPRSWSTCERGEVVTGFDGRGDPVCRDVLEVAMESERSYPSEPARAPVSYARTLSLVSGGALTAETKLYTVASATPDLRWADVTFSIDGRRYVQDTSTPCDANVLETRASFRACASSTIEGADGRIDAGDQLLFHAVESGQTLRAVDAKSNSVVLTVTIG